MLGWGGGGEGTNTLPYIKGYQYVSIWYRIIRFAIRNMA